MELYKNDQGSEMSEMRFEAPKTVEAASALLAGTQGLAKILSGGTDLLIQMRTGMTNPELVLDVKGISEMTTVALENGGYRFGAAVPCMQLVENAAFAKTWPGITDGLNWVGSVQVRGRASVGGNVCNASPAADTVPAMIAAGAVARIVGPTGTREIPVEQIAAGPGKTTLAKGELVSSFFLPQRPARSGDAYLRFTPRSEMDIAVVGCGVSLTIDEKGICTHARVSLGAVAERALLVPEAAAALIGTAVDEAALTHLAARSEEHTSELQSRV
jgi:carbon-monoxide dehydrogenase medium subunit